MQSRIQSWPRLISSFEEIPNCFQRSFNSIINGAELFPYTVYLPEYSWDERKTNEMLLCLTDKVIYIIEVNNGNTQVIAYPFEDIVLLNRGAMLLYSWIKFAGYVNGRLKTTTIEFNTVTEKLFEKLLSMIRIQYSSSEYAAGIETAGACPDLQELDLLSAIDYKFMNYAKRSVLPDERILEYLFQPAMSKKYFRFFSKPLSKAHMYILTGKELILIEEEYQDIKRFRTKKYLVVWNYIPLNKIKNISIGEYQTDVSVKMNIKLITRECISSIYSYTQKDILKSLAGRINSVR
ncbi:MAG TPA: hypothetical protein VEG39_17655 [Clostridia bacterium]|nr:hypothetical protein [Clostridia bacterium]